MFRQLMNRIGTPELQPPWGIWAAITTMVAAFLAIIIGSAISIIIGDSQYSLLLGWCIGAGLMVAFIWFTRHTPKYWPRLWDNGGQTNEPAAAGSTQSVFWYLLIGVGLAIFLDLVGRAVIGFIVPDPELLNLYGYVQLYGQPVSAVSWVLVVLFMAVLQPLSETLVFQGMLLPSLRKTIAAWPGFILDAAAYTMFHFVSYQPPSTASNTALIWIGIIQPFISGLIFCAVRMYTGSTRAAFLTHMAFGIFAVIKLLTLVSG